MEATETKVPPLQNEPKMADVELCDPKTEGARLIRSFCLDDFVSRFIDSNGNDIVYTSTMAACTAAKEYIYCRSNATNATNATRRVKCTHCGEGMTLKSVKGGVACVGAETHHASDGGRRIQVCCVQRMRARNSSLHHK